MFKYCVEDTETNKIQSPPSKTLRGGGGGVLEEWREVEISSAVVIYV